MTGDELDRATLTQIEDACACVNIRKAARAVTDLFDRALAPSGLRATQFSLLTAIAANDGSTLMQLAETLVMDRTTLTRNLRPLAAQRLVTISAGADRRTRLIRLTGHGWSSLQGAIPFWRQAQEAVRERLGEDLMRELVADVRMAIPLMQAY